MAKEKKSKRSKRKDNLILRNEGRGGEKFAYAGGILKKKREKEPCSARNVVRRGRDSRNWKTAPIHLLDVKEGEGGGRKGKRGKNT